MQNKFIAKWSALLMIGFFMAGCDVAEMKAARADSGPEGIAEQPIDLSTYTASTPEAQAAIDRIVAGEKLGSGFVDGGLTDESLALRATGAAGLESKAVQPPTRPTTADTRPKIYWVGKRYGPAETYYINTEINSYVDLTENHKPLTPSSMKVTYWREGIPGHAYPYYVVLLQDIGVETTFVGYKNPSSDGFRGKILSMWPYGYPDENYVDFLYVRNDFTSNYLYTHLPANVFEDPNGYPIRETWYWNPPWHFDKVSAKTTSSGEIRYAINTVEGYEYQTLIHRWSKSDFYAAYKGSGGWHDQGWYIKDFDVENGSVTAILYMLSTRYEEVLMWGVVDDQFHQQIRDVYWPQGYRGLMIDNSW